MIINEKFQKLLNNLDEVVTVNYGAVTREPFASLILEMYCNKVDGIIDGVAKDADYNMLVGNKTMLYIELKKTLDKDQAQLLKKYKLAVAESEDYLQRTMYREAFRDGMEFIQELILQLVEKRKG